MSIMSLLIIGKTREKYFVLVGGVNCFGIMGCRLDRWEDLMEYMVRVTGNS